MQTYPLQKGGYLQSSALQASAAHACIEYVEAIIQLFWDQVLRCDNAVKATVLHTIQRKG